MDPRKFFNQKGFLAAALPSIFKSYSATPTKSGEKLASAGGGSFSSGVLETKMDILTGETRELKIHSKLAAKNSVVLPSMARDMNVTRQNIVKLVKLQGGTATTKADMFFKRAGDREAGYESRFSKAGGVTTKTPTQVGEKPKEEKESGGILGFLGTIASYLLKGGLLGLLAIGVGKLLENQDVLEGIKSFVKQVILGIQKIIQKGSELLGDLFSDPEIKEGFIKTFVAVKDLFVKGINLLGDLASDPRFAAGVVDIFSAIVQAIKKVLIKLDTYLKDELNVPGGLLTALGVGGALYLAIIRLGAALSGLAATAGSSGLPGAPGKPGGRSGPALGLASAAAVLPFAVSMYHDYKNKNKKEPTPEEIEQMNQKAKADFINKNGREPTEAEMQSSVSTTISNANQKEATTQKLQSAGAYGVAAGVLGVQGIQGLSNLAPGKAPTTPTVTSKVPEGKLLTPLGSSGDKREMVKNRTMFEKLKVFFTKLQEKPKLMSVFKSKLAVRVGEAAMARLTALGVSLVAAPISAGASLIFSLALTIWSIYDLYQLYGLVFGDGGLYDEVMNAESDEVSTDTAPAAAAIIPNTTPTVEGAGGAAFGMYSKPGMKPKPVPVPYSAAADSQAANPTSVKATPTAASSAGAYRGQRSDMSSPSQVTSISSQVAAYGGYKSRQDFTDAMMPYAQKAATELKVSPEAIIAQWGLETGFGRAGAIQGQFNYGNIQGTYRESEPGLDSGRARNFIKYNSMDDFVDDYIKQLKNPRYAKQGIGQEQLGDREFFTALKKGGYAEDPNYVNTLTALAEKQRGIKPGAPGEVPTYEKPATAFAQNNPLSKLPSAPDFKMPTMGTLAAAAPSMGNVIDSASTGLSEMLRMFDNAMASVTNVTNNTTQASAAPQGQGKLPSVYDDTFASLFQRVA